MITVLLLKKYTEPEKQRTTEILRYEIFNNLMSG